MLIIFFGIIVGGISGIIPGLHTNTLASILGWNFDGSDISLLIIAIFGSQVVFSFVPAIFFGIPDEKSVVSVLPGHRMATRGRGYEALLICLLAGVLACIVSLLSLPIAIWSYPLVYSISERFIPLLLGSVLFLLIAKEKDMVSRFLCLVVTLTAGLLGFVVLNSGNPDPLFPLFCGLFAVSGIVFATMGNEKRFSQQRDMSTINFDFAPEIIFGVILGWLADLIPGISSPAQMALLGGLIFWREGEKEDARKYLALISAISVSQGVFAFASLEAIGKARVGALAIASEISESNILWMVGIFCFSFAVASIALLGLSKIIRRLETGNIKRTYPVILGYLILAVLLVSGVDGLIILLASTLVGSLPNILKTSRLALMACLIIPTILYYM
ncbi:MAG: tripartite tricarboxylate transporter permease [Candidatus Anstonellales archaeon]